MMSLGDLSDSIKVRERAEIRRIYACISGLLTGLRVMLFTV